MMMFQSSLIEIGITGWMLRMFCVPFSGPKLRFVLFWNGTLIRLPTGFCASLASSSALISANADVAVPAKSAIKPQRAYSRFIGLFPLRAALAIQYHRSTDSSEIIA